MTVHFRLLFLELVREVNDRKALHRIHTEAFDDAAAEEGHAMHALYTVTWQQACA